MAPRSAHDPRSGSPAPDAASLALVLGVLSAALLLGALLLLVVTRVRRSGPASRPAVPRPAHAPTQRSLSRPLSQTQLQPPSQPEPQPHAPNDWGARLAIVSASAGVAAALVTAYGAWRKAGRHRQHARCTVSQQRQETWARLEKMFAHNYPHLEPLYRELHPGVAACGRPAGDRPPRGDTPAAADGDMRRALEAHACSTLLQTMEGAYRHARATGDPQQLAADAAWPRTFRAWLGSPTLRAHWDAYEPCLDAEFGRWVRATLLPPAAATAPHRAQIP